MFGAVSYLSSTRVLDPVPAAALNIGFVAGYNRMYTRVRTNHRRRRRNSCLTDLCRAQINEYVVSHVPHQCATAALTPRIWREHQPI